MVFINDKKTIGKTKRGRRNQRVRIQGGGEEIIVINRARDSGDEQPASARYNVKLGDIVMSEKRLKKKIGSMLPRGLEAFPT